MKLSLRQQKVKSKLPTKALLLSFLLPYFFASIVYAQNASEQNLINQQDWITRQQQDKIEEDNRLKEQEIIKQERIRKKKAKEENKSEEESKNQTSISSKAAECFFIKSISLIDANSLSKKEQKKLTELFVGACVNAKTLTEIITAIQNYYNEQGYVIARVFVPKQNIQTGNLELKILEGRIEEIVFDGKEKCNLKCLIEKHTAFGLIEGGVLQIKDINQGIYQINRLPSNNATLKIEPGSADGDAKVIIHNDKKLPLRAGITYDNLGNDFTGTRRTSFNASLDNLLWHNDNINLNYSTNLNDNNNNKDIKSLTAGINFPLGYNNLSYDYSRSEFLGTNQGNSGLIRITGFSQRNNFMFDRVLFNQGNLRISGNLALTTKSSASYVNNTKIETSERKLSIGTIGFTISNYFKNGINLYLKPSYSKGLKILNAKQDEPNLANNIPKAQFDYFKLYASISKRLIIPQTEIPFMLATEIDSQYSRQTLFGTEQFSVGGYYSVRGFRENYIVGDSGYYLRNKANFNLGSLFVPIAKSFTKDNNKLEGLVNQNLVYLNQFSLEPFYDYGYVKNKYVNDGASGRLSGAGIKTIFSSKYFNASLTYSEAVSRSRLITSDKKENKMIYFEVGVGCC